MISDALHSRLLTAGDYMAAAPVVVRRARRDRFEDLREQARALVERGALREALEIYELADPLARALGRVESDLVRCNRAAIVVELESDDTVHEALRCDLRGILDGALDGTNCRLAAYTLARSFERHRSYRKALYYARLALQWSRRIEVDDWVASAHNQVANIQLAVGEVGDAVEHYAQALESTHQNSGTRRSSILANLGYCHAVRGHLDLAFPLLFAALRALRRARAHRYCVSPHLDLCYAYMEAERPKHARRHADAALELAVEHGDEDGIRNALYLLGDLAVECDELEEAHQYFSMLQRRFYPDQPEVVSMLLTVGVRHVVNLKA